MSIFGQQVQISFQTSEIVCILPIAEPRKDFSMSIFALDRRCMYANLALQTISSTGIDCVEVFGSSKIEAESVTM